MKLGKVATLFLIAITLVAVGALAGQLRQPAPAGAADNSAAILAQLKILNSRIGYDYQSTSLMGRLASIQDEIGLRETGQGLRGEVHVELVQICRGVAALGTGATFCPS